MSEHDPSPVPGLAPRPRDAHKGDFGRVLVIGGSEGLVGAAALAGDAALRAGAGLATIACPRSIYPILAARVTCPMTWPLPETAAGTLALAALDPLLERAAGVDAVAIGPGIGRHDETQRLVRALVERLEVPLVADADALFALAADVAVLGRARAPALVLTPHAGEMARLSGLGSGSDVQARRDMIARAFAAAYQGVTLVLKGAGTLVANGPRLWRNDTGNPGMATGGSGDVLTGVVAALLARADRDAYDAARLAVRVHGRAGDLAAEDLGETALIASDILAYLPRAFREVEGAAA